MTPALSRSRLMLFALIPGWLGTAGPGCRGTSSSSPAITPSPGRVGCTLDDTIPCGAAADGFACASGDNPETSDPSISCSLPTAVPEGDDFCCFQDPCIDCGAQCASDDQITCADPAAYAWQCAPGEGGPSTDDPSLHCGPFTLDADGVHEDYCCTYPGAGSDGGPPPPVGCTVDATLGCVGGADGYACAIGDNPESEDPGLSCSTPVFSGGEDDYCCYSGGAWSTTTCEPDDGLAAVCPDPSNYGYLCAIGDDPTSYDAMLNCSSPTTDADGVHWDYCCVY